MAWYLTFCACAISAGLSSVWTTVVERWQTHPPRLWDTIDIPVGPGWSFWLKFVGCFVIAATTAKLVWL